MSALQSRPIHTLNFEGRPSLVLTACSRITIFCSDASTFGRIIKPSLANRLVVKDLVTQGLSGSTRTSSTSDKNAATPRKYHGHSVKSIRPACRAFIQLPNDRDFLPLEIPGVAGNTYAKIFTYLRSKKPEPFKFPTRLYYAAIRWTARPLITEEYCELTLNAGEWSQETGEYKTLCKVRVNWESWSKVRRNTLLREFTTTREEAIEQAKRNKQIKGWIFFVGTQDPADPSIFHIDNYQLICCLSAQLIWPSKK